MSENLPFTGGGTVLAATGVATGLWWVAAVAVVLVVAGAVLARVRRTSRGRRAAHAR